MGTLERNVTITQDLGQDGRLSMKGVVGPLRVKATAGTEAIVHVTYRVRAIDQQTAERALEQGEVRVDRGDRTLEVETPERRLSSGLAWLFGGSRVTVSLVAEVPAGTRVLLETVSGTLQSEGIRGEQRYRSVSGGVRVEQAGGDIDVSTVSGSINVDAAEEIRLRAHTVSGSIWTRAPRFRALRLNTTSGDVRIAGALTDGGSYRAESISGVLELSTPTGVVAELKTLSGRIRSEVPHRLDGARGQWRAIVGDGSAFFRFDSMSGELRIREPMVFAGSSGRSESAFESDMTGTAARPGDGDGWTAGPGDGPGSDERTESRDGRDATRTPAGAWSAQSTPSAQAAQSATTGESSPSGQSAPPVAPSSQPGRSSDDELALLRAVERGELSVEDAHARLREREK